MDLQRSLLIGAIAILSFMLLTEWVAFKDARSTATVQESSRLIGNGNGNGNGEETDLPREPAAGVADAEDIPTAPSMDNGHSDEAAAAPSRQSDIIEVHTDVLQFAIDLKGGDIVELSLPKYLARQDTPDVPFTLLESNNDLTYIAQSGLIGPDGIDKDGRAQFTAAASRFDMDPAKDTLQVDLTWQADADVTITKRYTLRRGEYLIDIQYIVENRSEARWQGNLFGQIKRDSKPPPSADTNALAMQPFLGVALTQPDERFTKFDFDDLREEPFRKQLPAGWVAMLQHYFISAWIPNPEQSHNYSARVTRSGFNIAGFTSPALVVDPGNTGSTGARLYAGPKDQYRLKEISPYLDLTVDYGWLWWIAQPLFWLLTKFYALAGNWGVAIILLTVLIKAAFFQLSAASYRSMANMRRVQPKLMEIRERYADDKQKQSQAMMDLYKKEKINPMGGCLPILVQMPVFIGLYWMLMESVELRHSPFVLWITDLSVMDPYFVLPLLMGASMWFMQKLNPPPPDPMQAKIMQWMPIMFTFFFLWFPAGLVLYWLVNNLLSIAQQWYITRQIEKSGAPA